MKRHPRRTTTVMKKMTAAMMIIMLLLSSVSAQTSSAAGQYNGTESDYNNPEKYLMYCKLEDFYRKVERGSYSSYDLAWEISKYNVNRVEEDDGKAWSRFCQNQGDTAFKKYQLGYGLGRSTYRVLSGEPTLLDINICSVSNCVNFLNAVFGQKFSASDFEWFEYYLGFNYANCNYYRSDLCRETRKDTAIHEITVRGVRYYYITDTYDDMDPEFTGSWKYYTDFQNRSWNWVDAICVIGDYFYEIQYAYTPGAYGLTDAESVMKTIGSFTYYPEYEHGLAACRTPDITGKYLGKDTGSSPGPGQQDPGPGDPDDPPYAGDILDYVYPESGITTASLIRSCPKINLNFHEAYTVDSLNFSAGNIYLMKKGNSDTAGADDEIAFYWDLSGKTRKQLNGTVTARNNWAQWRLPSDGTAEYQGIHEDETGLKEGNTYYLRVDPGVITFKDSDAVFAMGQPGQPIEWEITIESEKPSAEHLEGSFLFSSSRDFDLSLYRDAESGFVYDSSWFTERHGTEFNPHLALLSLDLALAAGGNTSTSHGGDAGYYIKEFFKSLRLENVHINQDYSVQTENDTIGVAIASKKLEDDSTLITIALRGNGYGDEWGGNFHVGASTPEHEGFRIAAEKVINELCGYMGYYKISGKVKIWISGYSRVSAACNLAAAKLDDYIEKSLESGKPLSYYLGTKTEFSFGYDDIYAYGFEVPASTTAGDVAAERYSNIFSIVNPVDLVPYMPLQQWGFSRYGRVVFIPTPGQAEYDDHIEEMKTRFSDIYAADLKAVPDALQQRGIARLMNELYMSVPSREIYTSRYQDDMMRAIKGLLSDATSFSSTALSTAWIVINVLPKLYRAGTIDLGIIVPNLKVLNPFTVSLPYLASNLETLMLPHYGDYTLAWIETLENTGILEASMEWSTVSEDSRYYQLMVKFNCPVNVAVVDEEGKTEAEFRDGIPAAAADAQVVPFMTEDGGQAFLLPENRDLRFEISAYDEGTMQVTIMRYDIISGEAERETHYYDLPLQKDEVYQLDLFTGVALEGYESALSDPDGNNRKEDYDSAKDGLSSVRAETKVIGSGLTFGEGIYTKGSVISLTASPLEGENFEGWFDADGQMISDETTLVIHLSEDVLYEARFSKNTAPSGTQEQETTAPEESSGSPAESIESSAESMESTEAVPGTSAEEAEMTDETAEMTETETSKKAEDHSRHSQEDSSAEEKTSMPSFVVPAVIILAVTGVAIFVILRKKERKN